jgi:hypothetical protein
LLLIQLLLTHQHRQAESERGLEDAAEPSHHI